LKTWDKFELKILSGKVGGFFLSIYFFLFISFYLFLSIYFFRFISFFLLQLFLC